jgi:hypothetical protein
MLKLVPGMDHDDMHGSLQLSCRVTNLLARFHTTAAWPFGSCNPSLPVNYTPSALPSTCFPLPSPREPFPCLLPPHAFPSMNPPLLQPLTNHLFQVLPNPLHLDIIDLELL